MDERTHVHTREREGGGGERERESQDFFFCFSGLPDELTRTTHTQQKKKERAKEFCALTGFPADLLLADPDNVCYDALQAEY